MLNFFTSSRTAPTRRPSVKPRFARPRLEGLEERAVPALLSDPALAGLEPVAAFVQTLYLDELGRAGSPAELSANVAALNAGASPQAVVSGIINSPEARQRTVAGFYNEFLGRSPSGGEEQGWVNLLAAGQTQEQVLSAILSDPQQEFFNRAQGLVATGTPDQRFVASLYAPLLGRMASDAEVAGQVATLSTVGQQGLALGFLRSTEYRTSAFNDLFDNVLNRDADQAGLTDFLNSGIDLAAARFQFVTSNEFLQAASRGALGLGVNAATGTSVPSINAALGANSNFGRSTPAPGTFGGSFTTNAVGSGFAGGFGAASTFGSVNSFGTPTFGSTFADDGLGSF